MPRFAEGETVWAADPISGAAMEFKVLDVLEDFDEEYTEWALLLAPPVAPPGERGRSFCVSEHSAFHTKEEAEAAIRRQHRSESKKGKSPLPKLVRIYSNEHGAWWAPRYCGYRDNPARAGVFRYEEAKAKYPQIDYDKSKRDYFVDWEPSAKEAMRDMFALSGEEFRDKYMGILFPDEAGFEAFSARVNGAVEAVFREKLVEVRPIGEKPQ